MLFAAFNPPFDTGLGQCGLDRSPDLVNELLLVAASGLDRFFNYLVAIGIQSFEAEIFQLVLDVVDTKPVGNRRVDVQCLTGNGTSLCRRHGTESTHVMSTIGQLDHDDADVVHHRQQHLAKTFRLGFGAAGELNLIKFGYTIDNFSHFLAEFLRQFNLERRGVFDYIMQNGRDDGLAVHVQISQQISDCYGMRDVGFAAAAFLTFVRRSAELIGFAYMLNLIRWQIGFQLVDELSDTYGASSDW